MRLHTLAILATAALLAFCPAHVAFSRTAVKKTVSEFLKMSDNDTTYCELCGVIVRVRDYEKGNVFIKDGTGTVFIYGFRDYRKRGMKDMDIRKGDTLTVRGRRYVYNGNVVEIKFGQYVRHSKGPDHDNMPMVNELDKAPTFKSKGVSAFSLWVSSHLTFPEQARKDFAEGTVVVKFIVGRDGKIYEEEIISSPHPALSQEVIRVIRKSPKWKPGMQNGRPVRVSYTMPVVFVSEN